MVCSHHNSNLYKGILQEKKKFNFSFLARINYFLYSQAKLHEKFMTWIKNNKMEN